MSTLNDSNSESSDWLTTEQVANLYPQFTVSTLKTMRYRGTSPYPYYKTRRGVIYKRSEIEAIIESSKIDAHSN